MFRAVKDNINRKILPVPESINLSESTNGSIPIASTESSRLSHLSSRRVVSFKPMYTQETISEFLSDKLHNQSKKRTKSKSNSPSKKKSKIKCPNIVQNEREPLDTNLVTILNPVKSGENFDSGSPINAFLSESTTSRNSMQIFDTSAFQKQRTSSANTNLPLNSFLLPYKEGNKFVDSSYPNTCYTPIQHLANMSNNRSLLKNRLSQGSHIKTVVSDTYNISNKAVRKGPVKNQLNMGRGTIPLNTLKYDFQINTSIKTLPQSSKSTYLSSNALAKDQRINLNSMYASMGLDEDLCDVNVAGKLYPNAVWKSDESESINKSQSSLPVQDFPNVPIKIENDATLTSNMSDNTLSTCDSGSQSELSQNFLSNGMHVSMTFEAEPSYDDDLEDDLPLSFLKGKISATTSEDNQKIIKESLTSKDDLPLSLFIKKELIEDEIIRNNKEVSSQINEENNSERSYLNSNSIVSDLKANKNLILGSQNSLAAVRIKTEPDLEISSSEPISGISSQPSFCVHSDTSFLATQRINTTNNHNVSGVNLKDTIKDAANSNNLYTLNDRSSFSSHKLEQNTSELNSQKTFNATEHLGYKTFNEELYVAPSKVAAKKKNLKKTSRKKLKTSDQFIYPLPEADESVPENAQNTSSDNLSEMSPSSGPETNTNLTSSGIPVLEVKKKTPTKAKKRKVPKKSTEFDENLPIMLLIKRQKSTATDVNAPDSFLCTSSNKPANDKFDIKDFSNESSKDSSITSLIVPNEDVCSGLYSESSNKNEKLGSVTKAKCSPSFKKTAASKKGRNSVTKSTKKKSKKDSCKLEARTCNVPYSNNELFNTDVISSTQNENPQNTNLHPNMDLSKKDESLSNTNSDNLRNDITSKFSEDLELKTNTLVYMSFEEQNDVSEEDLHSILSIKKEIDSLDDNTVKSSDNSTDVHSVIKNIKKENDFLSDSESKALEEQSFTSEDHSCSVFSSQISDVSLELSPLKLKDMSSKLVTSESSVIPSKSVGSNAVSKKKKKPRRSNNWYKKKKSSKASKSKNSSPSTAGKNITKIAAEMDATKTISDTDTENIVSETDAEKIVSEIDSAKIVSEISTDLPSLAIVKRPVVLIKSLLPDLENISKYDEKEVQDSSLCLEQEVSLPIKGKKTNRNKKATRSKKSKKGSKSRAKKPSQLHEECMNTEMSNKDSEYENDKNLDVSKNLDISQKQLSTSTDGQIENITDTHNQDLQTKDFRNFTEVFNVQSTIHRSVSEETIYAPFDDLPDSSQEIIEIGDSPIKQTCTQNTGKKVITPLLNIAEIKEEIAEYESILAHSKIVQDTARRTIDRSQMSKAINLPNDHMISNSINNGSTSVFGSTLPNLSDISENSIKLNKNQPIEVKKELEDEIHQNGASIVSSLFANSSNTNNNLVCMYDSCDIISSANHAILNKMQNPNVNLASIKKEPSFSSQGQPLENILSTHDNCQSVMVSNRLSSNQSMDKILPVCSINDHLQPNFTQLQPKPTDVIDKIALSIKKEVCNDGKSMSSSFSNITSIRSQNDLIKAGVNNLSSISSSLTNLSSQGNPCSPSVLNVSNTVDDEIQILNIDVSKDVPMIDLTDDNTHKLNQDAQGKLSTSNSKSIPNELAKSLQSGNKENVLEINSHSLNAVINVEFQKGTSVFSESYAICNEQNLDPISNPKRILDLSNASTNKSINMQSNFEDEDICSTVERETINPFVIRKKYNEEYFQYPFPPSTVSYHSKPKNKLKTYSRINSNVLNLPIEEVESRLKSSDNVKQQFGNKLGDVIKLDKFPVSGSEVQCYHRILGVAPSQKLISKCFKSQDKKINMISSNNFSMFREFQEPISACTFENKPKTPIPCLLTDIVQGITECKMLPDSDVQNTSVSYDRDCPSADTKDSYDSYISNLSDKFMSDTQKKELKNITLKENEFSNMCVETNSNGRDSALSFSTSDIQNLSENNFTNVNFSNIKTNVEGQLANSSDINEISCSQNILNFLTLPSKEVLDSIVNNDNLKSSTPKIETNNESILKSSELGIEPVLSHELHLLSDSHEPIPQLPEINMDAGSNANEEGNISQNAANSNFNIINMPVTELRKILETAGSLHSNTKDSYDVEKDVCMESVSDVEKQCLWKSKATFEYNHTRSGSVIDISSKQSLENKGDGAYSSTSVASASADKDTNLGANTSAVNQLENDNSDDDYVEHEHIDNVSDDDQEESSDVKEKEEEKPIKIPQYKSRWEKIMERKSLESKEKEKANELLFKDRFPVSSNVKVRDKKCNATDEVISKPIHKIPEKSKKNEFPNVKSKNYSSDVIKSKNDSSNVIKSKNDSPNVIKSKNDSSKVINSKNDSKSKHAKKEVPKSSPKSKHVKEKVVDDASNLFMPDKQVKKTEKKETGKKNTESNTKSNDKNASKRFYGNRVTNRGTFLTQSTPEFLKMVKIPKKKKPEISKKHVNVRSEEYHKMVISPNINIEAKVNSYNNSYNDHYIRSEYYRNRHHFGSSRFSNSEKYKRVSMSNTRPSSISHPSHETNFSNRNIPLSTSCSFPQKASEEDTVQNRNIPLLSTQCSFPQRASEEDTVQNRKIPVLNTSYSFPKRVSEEDTVQNRKIPVLSTTYLFPQRSSEEDSRKIPVLSTSYTFPQLSSDDDTSQNRKIPVLVTSSSLSRRSSVESDQNRNVPNLSSLSAVLPHQSNDMNMKTYLNTPTSNPSQFPVTSPFQAEASAPTLELLQTIISSLKGNNSLVPDNTLPLADNTLPSPQYLNPTQNRNQFSSNQDLPFLSTIQSDSDSLLASASYVKDLPFGAFNSLNSVSSSCFSIKTEIDPSFDSASHILKNQFVPSVNSCQISSQSPQKATSTCLVPQNLKSLVGHEIIETSNVRLLMLEWSVDWLVQQQKLHDPPPISNSLKKVVSSYDGFEDYYNTYFPLLLLDTWHRIYVSWTHLSQHSPYFCEITSYSVRTNYISVECQTVFNTTSHPKGVFPDEGSILMIKYGTKSNDFTIKILGYVTNVKTRRFNPVTDSIMCGYKQPKDGNYEALQVLTLTFMGAYNSEDIDKRLPIRIHVLCNVRSTLKQNDALLYLQKSPLQRIILNPAGDALLSFALTPRNSPKEKVNECVRDITKGILSPHPLPLLTLVKAMPASDRLNIIPLLINKMKNAYKTKVLLCVRTVRALGDIAANICLHESLKLVIINKRCDTNIQFQRYLVDELVTSEVNSTDTSAMNPHLRNEAAIKAKRKIFKECDVVLSLIRNCHEVFIEETFTDTECVAQMCCIVDEANLCTEPESLIPILYGISKLILIGDPDYPAKVLSKTASSYDYNRSFFRRAYDLDLLTE